MWRTFWSSLPKRHEWHLGRHRFRSAAFRRQGHEIRTLINVGQLGPGEVRYPENEAYPTSDYAEVRALVEGHTPYFNDADDPSCDPTAANLLRELGKSSDVGVPIIVENEVWGEMWATRRPGEPPFGSSDADFLARIAGQFAVAIARAELFSRVSRLAYEDALTGVPNRRALEERLDRALERSARAGTAVSLLLCDLDGLKTINDGQGHEAGDRALRNVAKTLVRCAAGLPGTFVARLAGDEFCVLMEERRLDEALSLGRCVIEDLADGTGESLSFGAASAVGDGRDAAQLLGDADAALYVAKRRGGARVVSASESWSPVETASPIEREGPRPAVLTAIDAISADLDGRLASGSALDRLEAVAGALTEAGNFAYWAISSAHGRGPDPGLAVGDNRDRRHRGIRVDAGALEYKLSDYPVTQRIVDAGSGGFVAASRGSRGDPAELEVLAEMGFETVSERSPRLAPRHSSSSCTGTRLAAGGRLRAALRLAVRAAMPPRHGGADLRSSAIPPPDSDGRLPAADGWCSSYSARRSGSPPSPPITSRMAGASRSSSKRCIWSALSQTSKMRKVPSSLKPAVWTTMPSGGSASTLIFSVTAS